MSMKDEKRDSGRRGSNSWTFLSNHAHVLVCIARDPDQRLRDIADQVGITERAIQRILSDLVEAGCLSRSRSGRRNRYQVFPRRPLRHPLESHQSLGALLSLLIDESPADDKLPPPARSTPPKRNRQGSAKGKA